MDLNREGEKDNDSELEESDVFPLIITAGRISHVRQDELTTALSRNRVITVASPIESG